MANHYPSHSSDESSSWLDGASSRHGETESSSLNSRQNGNGQSSGSGRNTPSMALAPLDSMPPPSERSPQLSSHPDHPMPMSPLLPSGSPGREYGWSMDWSMVLWAAMGSLPLAILLSLTVQNAWLKPLSGMVLTSVVTALVAGALFHYRTKGSRQAQLRDDELDLLEVENNRMNAALNQLQEKQFKIKQRYQFLSLLAYRVRQVPEQAALFETVVHGLRELMDTDRVVVYRFNADWTGTIIAESVADGFPAALNDVIGDPCFREKSAAQYRAGRKKAIADIYQEPGLTDCHVRLLEQYRVRANLVVPLRHGDRLFGLLIAHHCRGPRPWSSDDTEFFSQISQEAEYHLEFLLRAHQEKMMAKQSWFLGDIAFRSRQVSSTKELFSAVVKGLRQLVRADRVLVYQFHSDYSGTMVAESVEPGFPEVLYEKIEDPCFKGRYVDLYRNGRVRGISDIYNEPSLTACHIRLLEQYDVKANLVAPLRLNDDLFGLLIVHQCSAPREWQPEDLDCISQVATQLEYAIEHLSFIHRLEQSVSRARLFGDLAFRARQSLDEHTIFKVATQGALDSLKTDRVLLYRFNSDWSGTMVTEAMVSDQWQRVLSAKIDDPCFRGRYVELYKNGRVRAINDIYQEPGLSDCHIRTLEQYGVKANMVAPIRLNAELFGLLIAHHCSGPREWTKDEIDFFSELATQTEYALGHVSFIHKMESERIAAEDASQEQRQQKETIQQHLAMFRQDIQGALNGDLTVRTTPPVGEMSVFAEFLNQTIENLQHVVQQVQSASKSVAQTTQTNGRSIAHLSEDAKRQSDALGEALVNFQSLAEAVQQVASDAQAAQLRVQQADQVVIEGDRAMNRTVEAISLLQAKVDETSQQVKVLGEASQNISRVVNLIRDLAGQTNVLALNAALEANGSSEQGQGFAVVAEEVRSLAERSAAATREIEDLVEEIQTETNQVVNGMESWRADVVAGTEVVEHTRQKLGSIATVSGEIRVLVESIAQATVVQSQTVTSVSHTMQEVQQIAQQNSEQSRNVMESSQELLVVAETLQEGVAKFKVQ